MNISHEVGASVVDNLSASADNLLTTYSQHSIDAIDNIRYSLYMNTVEGAIIHADGKSIDDLVHSWCAGEITAHEFDDILAMQRRINEVKEPVKQVVTRD